MFAPALVGSETEMALKNGGVQASVSRSENSSTAVSSPLGERIAILSVEAVRLFKVALLRDRQGQATFKMQLAAYVQPMHVIEFTFPLLAGATNCLR